MRAITDQVELRWIAQAEHAPIDVDLDTARLPFFWQKFAIREAGTDHEQGITFHHHIPAGFGSQQANTAGHEGQCIGQRRLSEQGFGHASPQ